MFWVICKVINGVVRAVPDQKSGVLWAQLIQQGQCYAHYIFFSKFVLYLKL